MTISKFRSFLYWLAKMLGDVSAFYRAGRTGSVAPIGRRVARCMLNITGHELVKPISYFLLGFPRGRKDPSTRN